MTTNTTPNSLGERVATLEAKYEHLATKDDISNLRLELEQSVNKLQANFDALKWVITLAIAGATILLTIIQIVLTLVLRG